MDDFFRHNFPAGNYSDSTTASGRHHIVFDFSTPPPVKYAPHSSPSLGHNYLVHSWSVCVCFHSTADGLNPNSFTSFVSFHAFYCSSGLCLRCKPTKSKADPQLIRFIYAFRGMSKDELARVSGSSEDHCDRQKPHFHHN